MMRFKLSHRRYPKAIGTYAIVNTLTNKRYFGSSTNLNRRINDHIRLLNNNIHYNENLQNDFNQTTNFFQVEIIQIFATKTDALTEESLLLNKVPQYFMYNKTKLQCNNKIQQKEFLRAVIEHQTPDKIAQITGIDKSTIIHAIINPSGKYSFLAEHIGGVSVFMSRSDWWSYAHYLDWCRREKKIPVLRRTFLRHKQQILKININDFIKKNAPSLTDAQLSTILSDSLREAISRRAITSRRQRLGIAKS